MFNLFKSHHPRKHAESFKYAGQGILHTFLNEANFRIQFLIILTAFFLGVYFDISITEWSVLIISLGNLLAAELLNTVIENFMDHLVDDHNEGVRVIKDISAGYVLINALVAGFILLFIFGTRILNLLQG